LLLNLVCYWKDIGTFCLLILKWLCVASSQELRQHQSSVDKAQDEKVFSPSLSEATLWYYSMNWMWWVCSSFSLCIFLPFLDALLFAYFYSFLVSSLRYGVSFLCHVMLRDCKVRTLQPKTSPLSQFVEWNLSLAFIIGISLMRWCYVHNLCSMICFLDSLICYLCGSFLCLTFLEHTGALLHAFSLFAQPGHVFLGSLADEGPAIFWHHQGTITYVMQDSLSWPVILVSEMRLGFFTAYWHKAWLVPIFVFMLSIKGCIIYVCPFFVICFVSLFLLVLCIGFVITLRCILVRNERLYFVVRLLMDLMHISGLLLYSTSKNTLLNYPLGSLALNYFTYENYLLECSRN